MHRNPTDLELLQFIEARARLRRRWALTWLASLAFAVAATAWLAKPKAISIRSEWQPEALRKLGDTQLARECVAIVMACGEIESDRSELRPVLIWLGEHAVASKPHSARRWAPILLNCWQQQGLSALSQRIVEHLGSEHREKPPLDGWQQNLDAGVAIPVSARHSWLNTIPALPTIGLTY